MVLPGRMPLVDLVTAATLATGLLAPLAGDEPVVAVDQHGGRLAIAVQRGLNGAAAALLPLTTRPATIPGGRCTGSRAA